MHVLLSGRMLRCLLQGNEGRKVHRGLPGAGRSLAPRTGLAFDLAGSAAPSLFTLGRLAGETLVSTLAAQTVLRVSYRKGRYRGPCTYVAYGRSTCAELASRVDTKVSHDDTVEWRKSRCVVPSSAPALPEHQGEAEAEAVAATRLPNAFRAPVPSCYVRRRSTIPPHALARPTRTSRSGRVFGAHPRGEFRTSERPQAT